MATLFTGVFAGKIAFCSAQTGGPNYYLTTCQQSDGHHGHIYMPGLNASTVGPVEKFLLYLFPDSYYRLQSGDLRWLTLNTEGLFLEYGDDPNLAAPLVIGGNPFGSSWQVHTNSGDQQLYYQILTNAAPSSSVSPNVLTLNGISGDFSTLVPTLITADLATIRQQKQAKNADFNNAILLSQDLSQGIDFTGASFAGAQLAGVNFSGATLDQAILSQTDLRGLNWGTPASAVGINLSGSNASGCQLGFGTGGTNQLNCQNANLSTADFTGANLINLNLQGAQLGSAVLNGATLDYANLTSAVLNNVVAIKGSFAYATLTDASAQMGIFIQAVFDHATLTRVRMGASSYLFLLNTNFTGELDSSAYPQQDLIGAFQQNGITLNPQAAIEKQIPGERWQLDDPLGPYKLSLIDTGIQVFNANPSLVPAVLQGASLVGALGSTASLAGADLRGVRWFTAPATLDHADLEDAALSGGIFISTDFTQANLSGADFSNSLLIQAKFTGCLAGPGGNQRAVSFEGAQLQGTDFSKATFNSALLTNAVVALTDGAPLLFLPTSDQSSLNTAGLAALKPAFTAAGFDLGSSPTVVNNSSWNIDNSQNTTPQSPKTYTVSPGGGGFQVFASGKYLFNLPQAAAGLLNQAQATANLVSLFATNSQHLYTLVLNAPITAQVSWNITPGNDAVFLKPYRFPSLAVLPEATRLVVYGLAPVVIEGLATYPSGLAFGVTQNLSNALSANAIGPAGVPFAWIGQALIDGEAFYLPLD